MGYTLYGSRWSGSMTSEVALALAGAPYQVVDVDLGADAQRGEGYARVNPHRKLPTLVTPAGETITESVAILLTLDERHPEGRLLPPPGSPDRAQALRWILFVATECYPMVEINDYPERFTPTGADPEAVREIARDHWRRRWLLVEQAVRGDPWLLPSGFSMADAYLAVVSRWAQQQDWRPTAIPKVEAIAAAVREHPVAGPVWRRHRG
jgi:glutathione S-transferase